MKAKIKIAQFGLGPIGLETVRLAATKPWAEVVGGVDIDPAKGQWSLGDLTGMKTLGRCKVFPSIDALLREQRPNLVFHTAVSRFHIAFEQFEPIVRHGINIVSSCEELLFPQLREPELASKLDQLCRATGARIVATGVNPGFVMDLLPLFLTGVSRKVDAIHVQRVVNASNRREPLQRKIGSGLPPAQFRRLFKRGKAGHAGLRESVALLAHCLGWNVKQITETGEAVVADSDIRTPFLEVKKGFTCGLHQRAEAREQGRIRASLDLKMYLDASNPYDAVQVEGDPQFEVVIKDGIAGDQATVAALVNTAPRLLEARPGLLLLSDLPMRWMR